MRSTLNPGKGTSGLGDKRFLESMCLVSVPRKTDPHMDDLELSWEHVYLSLRYLSSKSYNEETMLSSAWYLFRSISAVDVNTELNPF
jgi:hypothetical protein